MNNKTIQKNSTKLIGILAISVIATLMISVAPYAYATNAPIITSILVDDPDDLDEVYSVDDVIIITFDSPTNEPGGPDTQMKSAVNDLFTFSESIGQAYNGKWTAADTFTITIRNANTAGIVLGTTTVTPTGVTLILSADELSSASNSTSPVLSGDFGEAAFSNPWLDGGSGIIHYTGGNVGIGTTLPSHLLSVNGIIESTSGGFKFPDGTVQTTASTGTFQASTTNPVQTGYVNGYDAVVSYNCPAGKVITGVYSVHENKHEDRIFKYTCSNIEVVLP